MLLLRLRVSGPAVMRKYLRCGSDPGPLELVAQRQSMFCFCTLGKLSWQRFSCSYTKLSRVCAATGALVAVLSLSSVK